MPSHLWSRSTPCEDALGRAKEVTVLIDADVCIAIQYPPGEGIKFRSAEDAHQHQVAIRAAIVEQRRLTGGAA